MIKKEYTIAYVKGDLPKSSQELLKIKTKSGKLFLKKNLIQIESEKEKIEFKYDESVTCKYKRRQMFGFICLNSRKNKANILIPRINIFNYFIITNFFATLKLYNYLKKRFA